MAVISGDNSNEIIQGTPFDDIIDAMGGHDTVLADDGADEITGGTGNDTLNGEGGDDAFVGTTGDGHDVFFGGEGFDEINWTGLVSIMGSFSYAVHSVERIVAESITSFSSSSNTLDFRGVELVLSGEIHGGAAHNTIYASDEADTIRGGGGDDTLHGLGGDDLFVGTTGDGRDVFFGGDGLDRIDWGVDGALYLRGNFGAANGIESIRAHSVSGFTSSSSTLDFSRVALDGVASVRGDDSVGGVGHNKVITSLSRGLPDLVYDGGGGNDRVTVTIAPVDFVGASGSPRAGLIRDMEQSLTGNFGNSTGFTFDESLGLTVKNFNSGLSYGWFTLAGTLAEAPLANLKFSIGTISGAAGNDVLVSTTNNLDTYLAGDGDDLILHATGGPDRIVTGAGDDTIIVVGNRAGRINDARDTESPDEGLDQMFVVDGDSFSLGGALRGMELVEFVTAGGFGEIRSSGTNIQPDFTHTVLKGVSSVKGGVNNDTFITAKEHHDVGGGLVTYDGGNTTPYDAITVSLGAFTQLSSGSGLRSDLAGLLAATNVSVNGFTFDTTFVDDFDLRVVNIGDNRKPLDAARVNLGYIGHDGELVQVAPTTSTILIGNVPSQDTLTGTAGNDILVRNGNGEIMNAGDGDDLVVGYFGSGEARIDGQEGSDTYLLGASGLVRLQDTGMEGYDRVVAVKDGPVSFHHRLEGVEEINANGFDVTLMGSMSNDTFLLRDTALVGVGSVLMGSNGDVVETSTKAGHVVYDGEAGNTDRLEFYLTTEQADDADVLAEIAAFKAASVADRADWSFDLLDFTTRSFETVRFWDGDTIV